MPTQQRFDLIDSTSDFTEHIVEIRQRRRWIEEQWLVARRVWGAQGVHQFQMSDTSPAGYNIPYVRKAIERTVVRAEKLLNPNAKRYEISSVGDVSDVKLSNADMFMTYILNKKIKTKTNIKQLIRCLILYNRCHLKTAITVRNGQVWPTQRVVDPFNFYIYPETAIDVDDSDFIFEDFMISYEQYKGFVNNGIVEDVDTSSLTAPVWPYHLVERLAQQGLVDNDQHTLPTMERKKGVLTKMPTPFMSLTEVWATREDALYQGYIVWNLDRPKIVGFFCSQYDTPMYRSAVHRALPNEAYTNSMMDDVAPLEGLTNDTLNRFEEAVNREQGVYGVDDSQVGRTDSLKVKGGAIWHFNGDPREAMNFIAPPTTSTNILRAWQLYSALINSMGATGTIAEGQPGRNMPRAGGAVQGLVSLAMADTQDVSELVEQEILTPSLGDIYKVCMIFIPEEQLIRIPGGKSLRSQSSIIRKQDFFGDYEFEWIGSLQFQDEQVRAQRMMIFLNMAPQIQSMLQPMGYSLNAVELIQTIWRYGLGERSLQKIVVPLQELMQTMQSEEIERMMSGLGQQGSDSTQQGNKPASGSTGGLKYNLPSVTQGFVQQ